jgi:hypothetical protein
MSAFEGKADITPPDATRVFIRNMAMCRAWLALPLFVRLHSSFQDVRLPTPTQNHPVDGQKWHPTGPTSSQHDDLLPQHQDLGFQRRARSDQIDDNPKNYSAEIQHPAEDHPILRLTPTG